MNIQQTEHHEAVHSVIAYRLQLGIGKTSIMRDGDTLGMAFSERAWADGSTDREQIICLYAGNAAEKQYTPNTDTNGSGDDTDNARHFISVNPALSETQLRDEASKMVAENCYVIKAVAVQLLEDKTLDEDELAIILDAVDEGVDVDIILTEYRYRKSFI